MLGFYILTAISTVALLYSVRQDFRIGQWIAKPMAAGGFVAVAITLGGWGSAYGQWVIVALVLSWFGDVFLIPKHSSRAFICGLGSFLLGHVAYCVAFLVRGVDLTQLLIAFVVLVPALALVWRWLRPHVGSMRIPVMGYMLVITVMVAAAWSTTALRGDTRILVGAVLFYLSDLAVARQRFVVQSFANPLIGLPLYFGGQLILASTVVS